MILATGGQRSAEVSETGKIQIALMSQYVFLKGSATYFSFFLFICFSWIFFFFVSWITWLLYFYVIKTPWHVHNNIINKSHDIV